MLASAVFCSIFINGCQGNSPQTAQTDQDSQEKVSVAAQVQLPLQTATSSNNVSMSYKGSMSDISRISCDVGDGSSVYINDQELIQSGDLWSGTFADLPVGPNMTFSCIAFDDTDENVFSGSTAKTLGVDDTAVNIYLEPVDDGVANGFPQISRLERPGEIINNTSQPIRVFVNATEGETLTYRIVSMGAGESGSFSPQDGSINLVGTSGVIEIEYTAPNEVGSYSHEITLTNSQNNSVAVSFNTEVVYQLVDGEVLVGFFPVITGMTASRVGDELVLSVVVDDEGDQESLSYIWSTSIPGLTVDDPVVNPVYLLDYSPDKNGDIQIMVTDESGNAITATYVLEENLFPDNVVVDTPLVSYEYEYQWTRTIVSGWDNTASWLEYDSASNNLVVAGFYTQTVNFDPAGGSDSHTSTGFRDAYLWKMDSDATYNHGGWSRVASGGSVNDSFGSLVLDTNGDITTVGNRDTGSYPGNWGPIAFITKYAVDGTLLWEKSFGSLSNYCNFTRLDKGSDGSLYAGGYFNGSVDFNAEGGGDLRTAAGGKDMFLMKLTADGEVIWTKTMGGNLDDYLLAVVVSENSIYMTGTFQGQVNFNPDGLDNISSAGEGDGFVSKFASDGSYLWTRTFANPEQVHMRSMKANSRGQIVLTGMFNGSLNADGKTIISNGEYDAFIAAMEADGSLNWIKSYGGVSTLSVTPLFLDDNDNIFLGGSFSGTIDLDPGSELLEATASGSNHGYILVLNSDGEYQWSHVIGSPSGRVSVNSMTMDPATRDLYVGGQFDDTIDFDPTEEVDSRTSPAVDWSMFVCRFSLPE